MVLNYIGAIKTTQHKCTRIHRALEVLPFEKQFCLQGAEGKWDFYVQLHLADYSTQCESPGY